MITLIEDFALYSVFFAYLFSTIFVLLDNFKWNKSKIILLSFFICGTLFIGLSIIKFKYLIETLHFFDPIYFSLFLLLSPLLYNFLGTLISKNFSKLKFTAHFIPFLISLTVLIYLYQFRNHIIENRNQINFYPFYLLQKKYSVSIIYIIANIYLVQSIFYFISIIILYQKHKFKFNSFSNYESKELRSFKIIIVLILAILVFNIVTINIIGIDTSLNKKLYVTFSGFILTSSVGLLSFFGNKLSNIWDNKKLKVPASKNQIIYNLLKKKLLHLFIEEKIYLKQDLSLWDICLSLNSNRTYISHIINNEFGMNFNSFVNKYRIKEAKKILASKANNDKSLKEIAYQSGFNSLSSFNRAFKRFENTSPGSLKIN